MRVVPKEIEPPLIKKLRTGQAYVVARTGHGNYSAKLVFAPITKGRVRIGIISGVDGKDRETGSTVILHLLLADDRDDDHPYDEDDPKEEQHVLLCFADFHFFFLFDSESVVIILHQVPAAALSSRTRLQVGDVRSLLSCSATNPASTAAR